MDAKARKQAEASKLVEMASRAREQAEEEARQQTFKAADSFARMKLSLEADNQKADIDAAKLRQAWVEEKRKKSKKTPLALDYFKIHKINDNGKKYLEDRRYEGFKIEHAQHSPKMCVHKHAVEKQKKISADTGRTFDESRQRYYIDILKNTYGGVIKKSPLNPKCPSVRGYSCFDHACPDNFRKHDLHDSRGLEIAREYWSKRTFHFEVDRIGMARQLLGKKIHDILDLNESYSKLNATLEAEFAAGYALNGGSTEKEQNAYLQQHAPAMYVKIDNNWENIELQLNMIREQISQKIEIHIKLQKQEKSAEALQKAREKKEAENNIIAQMELEAQRELADRADRKKSKAAVAAVVISPMVDDSPARSVPKDTTVEEDIAALKKSIVDHSQFLQQWEKDRLEVLKQTEQEIVTLIKNSDIEIKEELQEMRQKANTGMSKFATETYQIAYSQLRNDAALIDNEIADLVRSAPSLGKDGTKKAVKMLKKKFRQKVALQKTELEKKRKEYDEKMNSFSTAGYTAAGVDSRHISKEH
jgi:hypothetical protein